MKLEGRVFTNPDPDDLHSGWESEVEAIIPSYLMYMTISSAVQ
jgi:hypothetical protein